MSLTAHKLQLLCCVFTLLLLSVVNISVLHAVSLSYYALTVEKSALKTEQYLNIF